MSCKNYRLLWYMYTLVATKVLDTLKRVVFYYKDLVGDIDR